MKLVVLETRGGAIDQLARRLDRGRVPRRGSGGGKRARSGSEPAAALAAASGPALGLPEAGIGKIRAAAVT